MASVEPILVEDRSRYVMFPIKYPMLWNVYKQCVASFWTPEEVMRHSAVDIQQWTTDLGDVERDFFRVVLAFFAASDGIVTENLAQNFMANVHLPEARCFYGFQIMMENIHSETYVHFVQAFTSDPAERDRLFRAIDVVPTVQAKAKWCFKWFDSTTHSFATRIIGFAIVEGVFFCSSFAAIYWLRQRGILPGLCFANELIARDEDMHMRFVCLLYAELHEVVPVQTVYAMLDEAVGLEKEFFRAALPMPLDGLNAMLMAEYIEYIADYVLSFLQVPPYYNTANPFMFMSMLRVPGRSNFFERPVSDYAGAFVYREVDGNERGDV